MKDIFIPSNYYLIKQLLKHLIEMIHILNSKSITILKMMFKEKKISKFGYFSIREMEDYILAN